MRKNRIVTMSLREIRKSRKRFFSLCVLSALGVSFFTGMKMSGPTMLESLDKYYDDNRMYDLKVISTLGLDDEDIEEIKRIDNQYEVVGSHTKDAIFNDGEHEAVIRIHEINKGMNNILLIKGRMPEKYNEIVVENGIEYKTKFRIGDKITLELEDDDTTIKTNELEIVGIVMSPEYLNNNEVTQSRGNTSLGNGQVAYYSYALNDLFELDYYTEIYVLDNGATEYTTADEDYLKKIKKDEAKLESIKESRQSDRYIKLLDEANNKLKEEEEKANNELFKAQKELEQYKIELDNGKRELDNAKRELNSANQKIQNGYETLKESKEKLAQGNQKLIDGKKEIEDGLKDAAIPNLTYDRLADFVKKYDSASFSISDVVKLFGNDIDVETTIKSSLVNIKLIASTYNIDLEEMFNTYGITDEAILDNADVKLSDILDVVTINQLKEMILDDNFIFLVKESIPKDIANYDWIVTYLNEFSSYKNDIIELFDGIRNIENGYLEYNKNLNLVNDSEKELNKASKDYDAGIKKYYSGLNEYNSNLELYNKGVEEFEKNKKKVSEELDLAREKINKIENASWFIQTREGNNEYITYLSSYNSIEKLSNLFPVIFFLVSIMISLLSMARMAIENRSEIGTLKALGFSNHDVRLKFVVYSLLATLIGGVLGAISGYLVIPNIIIGVFNIIHNIPVTVYSTNPMPIILGLLISIFCIVGSAIITINNLVREKTTVLLRPIAPPIGKKILLEKIPFLWDKFKYSNKLTIRNIFRYKRRIFMSIFGIASCTMILLAGYGIKDSIAYVVDKQYNEINHNDALIALDGKLSADELDKLTANEGLEFNVYARIDQVEVENKRLSFIIPYDDEEFKKALTIIDVDTKEEISLKEDSVVVTEKLAKYFNKKVGDTIEILESDNLTYEFTISNICENYIGDYIYITKDTYEKSIGKYSINAQYLKFKDLTKENEIMSEIKNGNSHILSTVLISTAKEQADVLFKSLNIIVYVLVLFSGALSFVVFYSLAYINISERQREIATLKVLGFYNREVDNYMMKEEFIITILGILVGLGLGTFYAYMLIDSIEINTMQYIKSIHLDSYLQTSGFMLIFTIIVSVGVHFALKRINLIESLKSVE